MVSAYFKLFINCGRESPSRFQKSLFDLETLPSCIRRAVGKTWERANHYAALALKWFGVLDYDGMENDVLVPRLKCVHWTLVGEGRGDLITEPKVAPAGRSLFQAV